MLSVCPSPPSTASSASRFFGLVVDEQDLDRSGSSAVDHAGMAQRYSQTRSSETSWSTSTGLVM